MHRRAVVVAALALFWSPWPSLSSRAATALDVDCTSNVRSSFPPELGKTDQQSKVAIVDTYSPCTASDSTLKSGTRHLEYAQTGSCSTKATATPATDEILWNNGLPAPRRARTTARRRHSRQRH